MNRAMAKLGPLAIESPAVTDSRDNYRLRTWPPQPDFPVVIDHAGRVISRYCDNIWDISLWCGMRMQINFGDGHNKNMRQGLSAENANLLRQACAWWLWGPQPVRTAHTLKSRYSALSRLAKLCDGHGIAINNLYRFPNIIDEVARSVTPSSTDELICILHDLYENKDSLGFYVLDTLGIRQLCASMPRHQARQTAYIPPRIWSHQIVRLKTFLDECYSRLSEIEDCFNYCLDLYIQHYGSVEAAFNISTTNRISSPFSRPLPGNEKKSFYDVANEFEIYELMKKWLHSESRPNERHDVRLTSFSSLLTLIGYAGTAYIANLTLMRIGEAWTLRSDCLQIEKDPSLGDIYFIRGTTKKTLNDPDAKWIASSSIVPVIDLMARVSELRMRAAALDPRQNIEADDLDNPYLVNFPYEPWTRSRSKAAPYKIRHAFPGYASVTDSFRLFDRDELIICEEDLRLAMEVNADLDTSKYKVGAAWNLTWHQLRRTGAVNMLYSGVVSDASLQYQMKHISREMTLYYGHGHSRIGFNSEARGLFVRALYESVERDFKSISDKRFVSPFGNDRKISILNIANYSDSKTFGRLVSEGSVSWRSTLFGGCTKAGPCEYGGIDNFIRCGGGDEKEPCADAIYDHEKLEDIENLRHLIEDRLLDATPNSPYFISLSAQLLAVKKVEDFLGNLSTDE